MREYIASGFYYHVYRVSTARVRKEPTSWVRKAWLLAVWRMTSSPVHWWREVQNIDAWFAEELRLTRELCAEFPTLALLGNPSPLTPDGSYEQDYARSLGHLIANSTALESGIFEDYVRQYCDIQHQLWRHGFGERIWNFTFNCGVDDATGRLVLIDINELTRAKETVRAHILDRKWRSQNSLEWLARKHPHLRDSAERVLDEMCTEETLDALWGVGM
jgi:hypothetical protein